MLAMPHISDPRFERSVIFMCAHDKNGAMGIVINEEMANLDFNDLLDQLGIKSDIHLKNDEDSQHEAPHRNFSVMSGGPVEPVRGFLLHSKDFEQNDTISVNDHFSISGTIDTLREIATGGAPKDGLFVLGYAGWTPGQLEQELQQNSWLVVDADPALVFHDKTDEKWTMALAHLGVDPAMLSGATGRA